jgi:hypothetical protein
VEERRLREFPPVADIFDAATPDDARDCDGRLNRACSDLNDLARSFSGRPGVIAVDIEACFDERAPCGIAGHEAIEDHLHPTVGGQALIAVRLLQALADAHLFTTPERLQAVAAAAARERARAAARDGRRARRALTLAGAAGHPADPALDSTRPLDPA